MRKIIKKLTGIPVSIGIASTKTLAKIANHIAKKQTALGVFDLTDIKIRERVLETFPVEDIWGIGHQLTKKLNLMKIKTAKDLRDADSKSLRRTFSVVLEKTILELRGISCIPLEETPAPKQQIMCSRSFGRTISLKKDLEEAVAFHVTKAAEKLRKQCSRALGIYVFLHTNPFSVNKKQYANSFTITFPEHTNDTSLILRSAHWCLNKLFKSGFEYHKLGIMLLDLVPEMTLQQDLFMQQTQLNHNQKDKLMSGPAPIHVKKYQIL